MSLRLERVRELLKRELGEAIRKELPVESVGLISVNDVDVAPNLQNATVYIGVFGDAAKKKRAMEALLEHRRRIQWALGQAVILKYTPHLRFVLDDSIERGNRVLRILDELDPEKAEPSPGMKAHPKIIDRVLEIIRESRRICVAGHIRPDGDCIGSQLGLTLALQHEGKQVMCWNEDKAPPKYAFLDRNHTLRQPEAGHRFDLVIATDCASFERLGTVGQAIAKRQRLINIDHHASNTRYGDVNWISETAASTGELIFQLLRVAKWPITSAIADNLFTAVSTDTGSFQYPTTRPETYNTAGELVRLGAHLDIICNEVYQSFSLSRVRLLKHLYNHFHLTHHNQIAYLWLREKDYVRTGADRNDTEGLIDHIRSIEPVVVACVFEEAGPNLTRMSLRSKSAEVNVNDIAAQFGGGGHAAAAGARIEGKPLSIQRRVIGAIRKALDKAR